MNASVIYPMHHSAELYTNLNGIKSFLENWKNQHLYLMDLVIPRLKYYQEIFSLTVIV